MYALGLIIIHMMTRIPNRGDYHLTPIPPCCTDPMRDLITSCLGEPRGRPSIDDAVEIIQNEVDDHGSIFREFLLWREFGAVH